MTSPYTGGSSYAPFGASSASEPSTTQVGRSWLDYRHPLYATKAEQWRYIADAYTGDCLQPDKIGTYLVKRAKGESEENYRERCALADYSTHMAHIVNSLAGMLSHADDQANRVYDEAGDDGAINTILGDPTDRTSIIGKLYSDADGLGTGWRTLHKQLAGDLTAYSLMWGLVDAGPDKTPRVRYLPPLAVVNWLEGPNGLVEVLICESADERTSIEQDPEQYTSERYIRYTLTGWQRYRAADQGGVVALEGEGATGTYAYFNARGERVLPVYRVILPLAYDAGYLLARRCIALWNKKSDRDNLVRNANYPRLCLVGPSEHIEAIADGLSKGANMLHELPGDSGGQHHYIAPPVENAEIATTVLEGDRRDVYTTTYREYEDAAHQQTATEIKQDVTAGEGAFLQMLASSLDDAETSALQLVAQQQLPGERNRQRWFVPHVERASEFLPKNPEEEMLAAQQRAFGVGKPVPLGTAGRLAVAKQLAAFQGVDTNEDELKAEIEVTSLLDMLERAQRCGLPIATELRVQAMLRLAAANGFLDAAEVEAMVQKLRAQGLEEMVTDMRFIAEADDARRQLEAQHFGGPVFEASTPIAAGDATAADANTAADDEDDEEDEDDQDEAA